MLLQMPVQLQPASLIRSIGMRPPSLNVIGGAAAFLLHGTWCCIGSSRRLALRFHGHWRNCAGLGHGLEGAGRI